MTDFEGIERDAPMEEEAAESLPRLDSGGPVVSLGTDLVQLFAIDLDGNVVFTRRTGATGGWSTPTILGGPALAPVSAAVSGGNLDLYMVGADAALYHKRWSGLLMPPDYGWIPGGTEWTLLGRPSDCYVVGRPEPVYAPDWFGALVLGSDSKVHLYREFRDPHVITDTQRWHELGAAAPASRCPPKAVPGDEGVDVFVTDTAGHIQHAELDFTAPGKAAWIDLGQPLHAGVPAAAFVARPGALRTGEGDLVVYALATYSRAFCKVRPRSAESWPPAWTDRFGQKTSTYDGTVVAGTPHTWDVFARNHQYGLVRDWHDRTGYHNREVATGVQYVWLIDEPHVVSPAPTKLDVFFLGTDSLVYQLRGTYDAAVPGNYTWANTVQVPIGQISEF